MPKTGAVKHPITTIAGTMIGIGIVWRTTAIFASREIAAILREAVRNRVDWDLNVHWEAARSNDGKVRV